MMTETTPAAPPHMHDGSSVAGMMRLVCLALIPGLLCYFIFFGWGIVIQCCLCCFYALVFEWLLLKLTGRPVAIHLRDGSAVVTALLFALTITPFAPWWVTLLGIGFALGFAKHLYGGLGMNPFNPAMAGYLFVLLCFPAWLNQWPPASGLEGAAAGAGDYLGRILHPASYATLSADTLSGASPLNHMQSALDRMAMLSEIRTNPIYGSLAGRGWEWINLAYLAGGLFLLWRKVITWRIPLGVILGLAGCSLLFTGYDNEVYAGPLFHLFAGGSMLTAFFIATDPVTAPATPAGGLLYGLLIGVLAYLIRTWGAYPDGFAFAVLIANAAAPLIAHYTRPVIPGTRPG